MLLYLINEILIENSNYIMLQIFIELMMNINHLMIILNYL